MKLLRPREPRPSRRMLVVQRDLRRRQKLGHRRAAARQGAARVERGARRPPLARQVAAAGAAHGGGVRRRPAAPRASPGRPCRRRAGSLVRRQGRAPARPARPGSRGSSGSSIRHRAPAAPTGSAWGMLGALRRNPRTVRRPGARWSRPSSRRAFRPWSPTGWPSTRYGPTQGWSGASTTGRDGDLPARLLPHRCVGCCRESSCGHLRSRRQSAVLRRARRPGDGEAAARRTEYWQGLPARGRRRALGQHREPRRAARAPRRRTIVRTADLATKDPGRDNAA